MLELLKKCEKLQWDAAEGQPILELRMPTTSAPIMMVCADHRRRDLWIYLEASQLQTRSQVICFSWTLRLR